MGNSDSKEEIIVKCSLEEMVKHFFKDYIVVWHDPSVNSPENQQYIMQLKQFCDVLTFTEWEKAQAAIQESKAACYVITSGTNGEMFVEKIYESSNIVKIYVFCMNKEYHSEWAKKYQKISCIETNIQNLINQIKQNLLEWYQQASSLKLNLPAFAPIFNDGDKSQMNHLHRYLNVIPNFKNRLSAKTDFLHLSKLIYTDPRSATHIAAFDRFYNEYSKTDILRWYTRETFLYKVTNNCLRIASSDSIQYCRFLLKDLEQAVKEHYQTKSKDFNGLLYRGAYLSQEEWTSLKENQNKEIEMLGFLSVSKEKNVALNFMRLDPSKKVLITIIVPKGPNQEQQGFAEIEEFSLFPQEREILFNVKSRFTVLETEDEYSPELPCRHLVLLYGAQGFRRFTAEQNPVLRMSIPHMAKIICAHCSKGTHEDFLFRPLDKKVYYCRNCLERSHTAAAFLCVPLKNAPTATEKNVKGCLLINSTSFETPFYGYKCSQCQAKKQKRYFICTDCSLEKKLTWCESCFTPTLNCIQANHNIVLESVPFTFWCEKMSEKELTHLEFQTDFRSDYDEIFFQPEMYLDTHDYDKAIAYYNLFIEQKTKTKTKDKHLSIAYQNISRAYLKQENYEKALENSFKSLEVEKTMNGHKSHGLAMAHGMIGFVYNAQGEYKKAREYHQKSLDMLISIHGEKQEAVASAYNNIGAIHVTEGKYDQALECYVKALEIAKSIYGEIYPDVATFHNNIGSIYVHLGEYVKGLDSCLKSLEIKKSLYGENHPGVSLSYGSVGTVYLEQKEGAKAVEYYWKSLGIKKLFYGENTHEIAICYFNLGKGLNLQEEYDNALEYHFKALNINKAVIGENKPLVAASCYHIASVYMNQKEYTKALEYCEKSLKIYRIACGEVHPETIKSQQRILEIKSFLS